MNLRVKYAKENLDFCLRCQPYLTEWEEGFVKTLERADLSLLTVKQFNKLKDVAERVAGVMV